MKILIISDNWIHPIFFVHAWFMHTPLKIIYAIIVNRKFRINVCIYKIYLLPWVYVFNDFQCLNTFFINKTYVAIKNKITQTFMKTMKQWVSIEYLWIHLTVCMCDPNFHCYACAWVKMFLLILIIRNKILC